MNSFLKKAFFSLVFTGTSFFSFSQTPSHLWSRAAGSSSLDAGNSIATDSQGNVYVLGTFIGTVDLDPGVGTYTVSTATAASEIFLQKLDQTGNFVWAKTFAGRLDEYAGALVVNGNDVYICGNFSGTVDFDPGPGVNTLIASGSSLSDGFVLKLNTTGNFIWVKQVASSANGVTLYALAVDNSGNVYTSGTFDGTVDFDPGVTTFSATASGALQGFVLKLDNGGSFQWARLFGGSLQTAVYPYAVCVDAGGTAVVASGFFTDGIVDMDPGPATFTVGNGGAGDHHAFNLKLDGSGNFVWHRGFNGFGSDVIISNAFDNQGNLLATGHSSGNFIDFDPGPGTFTLSLVNDAIVEKFDAAGNFQWAKAISGPNLERGYCIAADNTGNVYSTGYFTHSAAGVDFDPGPGTYTIASPTVNPSLDIYISKLNAQGDFVWAKRIGGNGDERGNSLTLDGQGNFYFTGRFEQSVQCGTNPLNATTLTAIGNNDVIVSKWSQCGSSKTVSVTAYCSYVTGTYSLTASDVYFLNSGLNVNGCDSTTMLYLTIPTTVAISQGANNLISSSLSGGTYQWYSCGVNGNPPMAIPGATASSYTAQQGYPGLFVVAGYATCTYTSACLIPTILTGISESDVAPRNVRLFPNPVQNGFSISFENVQQSATIHVSDVCGRTVATYSVENAKGLFCRLETSPGLYIVTVLSADGLQTFRIVKE